VRSLLQQIGQAEDRRSVPREGPGLTHHLPFLQRRAADIPTRHSRQRRGPARSRKNAMGFGSLLGEGREDGLLDDQRESRDGRHDRCLP